jgi:hypothetical protein
MKTVHDLMRHRATLEAICQHCDHSGVINARFLARGFGMSKLLVEIAFACSRCKSQCYRLHVVPDHLAESKSINTQWFGGVYNKYLE